MESTATAIFAAFERVPASRALYTRNLAEIEKHLAKTHGFPLSALDREGLAYVYEAWFTNGPDLHYELNNGGFGRGGRGGFPTYAELMTGADDGGQNRSFLGTHANFVTVKELESRNLLVPVVGNSAAQGPARGGELPAADRANGVGILRVQRRAIPAAGRPLGAVLPECERPAGRWVQCLHPLDARRLWRGARRDGLRPLAGADRA